MSSPQQKTTKQSANTSEPITRRSFGRKCTYNAVKHGDISKIVCERIFIDFLRRVDMSESTEDDREQMLEALAEVLVHSTSEATDYSAVTFDFEGEEIALSELVMACNMHYSGPNPLRTWTRCFRDGQMCARISDLIDHPENLPLRLEIASRYGVSPFDARLCFDASDGLLKTGLMYSVAECRVMELAKTYATSRALGRAVDKGDVRPIHDSTGKVGHEVVSAGGTHLNPVAMASTESRTGFRPMR